MNLNPFVFFGAFSLLVLVFLFLAKLLKKYYSNLSYGLAMTLLLGLLINLLFLGDNLKVSRMLILSIIILTITAFTIFTFRRFNISIKSLFKLNSERIYILKIIIAWGIASLIILLPLVTIFPKGTLVTGDGVANDTIVHSVYSKGFAFTDSFNIDSNIYARGFHSFVYYFNEIVSQDTRYMVFICAIFILSFLVFTAEHIINRNKKKLTLNGFLAIILPVTPFLVIATLYHGFASQIASIPFLIITIFEIFNLRRGNITFFKLFTIAILTFTTFNLYSIFAVNLIVFAAIIKLIFLIIEIFKKRQRIEEVINMKLNRKRVIGILGVILLLLPSFSLIIKNIQFLTERGSYLISTNGNLSNYLSPFHITGTWSPLQTYRDQPGVPYAYGFIFLLITQLFFIFSLKKKFSLKITTLLIAGMVFISVFVFENVYVEFKYLTFLIPAFTILLSSAILNFDKFKLSIFNKDYTKYFITIFLALFLGLNVIHPLNSYKKVPYQTGLTRFYELQYIKDHYFENSSTMILTADDWIEFYLDESDDIAPITGYQILNYRYNNEDFDFIIKDTNFVPDIDLYAKPFLDKYPELYTKMNSLNEDCIEKLFTSYTIYNLRCNAITQ